MVDGPIETADELIEVEANCDRCLEKRNEKVKAVIKIIPTDKGKEIRVDIVYLCADCEKTFDIDTTKANTYRLDADS